VRRKESLCERFSNRDSLAGLWCGRKMRALYGQSPKFIRQNLQRLAGNPGSHPRQAGPFTLFSEDVLHLADFLLDFPAYLFVSKPLRQLSTPFGRLGVSYSFLPATMSTMPPISPTAPAGRRPFP